jgi:hypothetical protein
MIMYLITRYYINDGDTMVQDELSADFLATQKILDQAFKDGEYYCKKKGCGFKDVDGIKFLEHIAVHLNEFCRAHKQPEIKVVRLNGAPSPR